MENFRRLWLIICFDVAFLIAKSQCGWTYGAIDDWPKKSKFCASHLRQSPVDIDTSLTQLTHSLRPIQIVSSQPIINVTVKNTGSSLKVIFPSKHSYYVQFQPGENRYKVLQAHFHWGSSDNKGSEHAIDGKGFPLEGHLVCYDSENYKVTDDQLIYKANSLYVLGFFFEIGDESNELLDAILSNPVRNYKDSNPMTLNIMELVPNNIQSYFRYWGSLTTPPCTETVMWTVAKTPLKVTKAQMKKLRRLKYPNGLNMVDNYRPVQPLNSERSDVVPRVIYFSKASTIFATSNWFHLISFLLLSIWRCL